MEKGWFRIDGIQAGDRSIAEQMLGLAPALESAKGKSVLDLGAAEGCIALEFARAGAMVHGVEFNERLFDVAQNLCGDAVKMFRCDLNNDFPPECEREYDIVLLLAILHKLVYPARALKLFAALATDRVVIRLPFGSKGAFQPKYGGLYCDTNKVMPACGFKLEQTLPGPRKELVQHWRR